MFGFTTNAKLVTQEQAVEIFNSLDNRGMVPVSLTYLGKLATRKADSTQFELPGYTGKGGRTYFAKFSQINGNLGLNYEDKVNRQREKEGLEKDFVAAESAYDYESKAIRSKGDQKYLYYFPVYDGKNHQFISNEGEFKLVTEDKVAEFGYKKSDEEPSNKQGVENEVRIKSISLSSIVAFTLDKTEYIISDIDDIRKDIIKVVIGRDLWY